MAVITKNKLSEDMSSNWILKPEKDYFTQNELIDAYLKGNEEQKNENQRILLEKLEKNVKQAKEIVESIAEEINKKGFKLFKSYLRINDIVKYDAIFDIRIEDFTSDNFNNIYSFSRVLKREINTNTFNINFTFMPHTEDLNEKRIESEGFIFMYEKRG
ncbi:hypothetical protein K8R61_01700 [bacterium]|nr:hypothetical protein [bacterium]